MPNATSPHADSAYVLAVLGESPALLTELLWWVSRVAELPIAGVEVWTTARGATLLQHLVDGPGWQQLTAAIGNLPALRVADSPSASPGFQFHLHTFSLDGVPLTDVRSREESEVVSAQLHDRLRTLNERLPPHRQLIGSLAGGRKTVSAALQTAFSLHAREIDRLVHVLQHEAVERLLRERCNQPYWFPTDAWADKTGVPVTEQLVVYDVAFPRLRAISDPALVDALRRCSWSEVWQQLGARHRPHPHATICRRDAKSWDYQVFTTGGAQPDYTVRLPHRPAALLIAIVTNPDADSETLYTWLEQCPWLGWPKPPDPLRDRAPAGDTATEEQKANWAATRLERRQSAIRTAANALRERLGQLPPQLSAFAPPLGRYRVDADVRVDPAVKLPPPITA